MELLLIAMIGDPLLHWAKGGMITATLVAVGAFNVLGGYAAMAALAIRTLELRDGRRHEGAWRRCRSTGC